MIILDYKVLFVCLILLTISLCFTSHSRYITLILFKVICCFNATYLSLFQGLSSSQLGGLCSYPNRYLTAPSVTNVPATFSSASTRSRNHFAFSSQPWLRFSPYLIPAAITLRQQMFAARLNSRSNSLSESRESRPVPVNHRARRRTASPKNNS